MTPLYIDLLISDDDLSLDSGGEPLLVFDRQCIEQDIKNLIRESGLLIELIGERDAVKRANSLQQLELLIEDDDRLMAGTIAITQQSISQYLITADTVDFGSVSFLV